MKKMSIFVTVLVLAILLVPAITACDSGSSDDEEDIPEGVLYLARDIFGTLALVFQAGSNPASGSYPAGMTVANGTTEGRYTITLSNFLPEGSDAVVNGSAALAITDTDPYRVTITGTITLSGADYSAASLNAAASWDEGVSPSSAEPSSLTGTFIVDGASYSVPDIMAALDEMNADEPEPPPEVPPVAPPPVEASAPK